MVPGVVGSSPITHPRQEQGDRGNPGPLCSASIGASPSGKARDFDSLIRWFESSRPSQANQRRQRFKYRHDPVAQSAEQLPFKQWVRGSNPRRVTKEKSLYRCYFSRYRDFSCSKCSCRLPKMAVKKACFFEMCKSKCKSIITGFACRSRCQIRTPASVRLKKVFCLNCQG